MWQEDTSGPFDETSEQLPDEPQRADECSEHVAPSVFPPMAGLPHVVPMMDLYAAAYARAVADHELNKLFNPEYYI
jgi:hypothetical protein